MANMTDTQRTWPVLTLLLAVLTLNACSTTTLLQSKDLSSAGLSYADAVSTLIDTTSDAIINDDSDTLLTLQTLTAATPTSENKQQLDTWLKAHDDSVQQLLLPLHTMSKHTQTLKSYFLALQALADNDAPTNAVTATQNLSASINSASEALAKTAKVSISADQQKAIGNLAGLVAKSVQAGLLRDALTRDAPVISKYLLLQQKAMSGLAAILQHSYQKNQVLQYRDNIKKPYITRSINNPGDWKTARKNYLNASFVNADLDAASAAASKLQLIWESIVQGKPDTASVQAALTDLRTFAGAIQAVKDARAKGEPT